MSQYYFDHVVIGGGLAGLAAASSLLGAERSVCLIEKESIASGASGTPLGLVNPATGRYATKSWRAEDCYKAVYNDLKKVSAGSGRSIFRENGVLRPALTNKIADRMQENTLESNWPEDWAEWISQEKIHDSYKGLNVTNGGVWLPIGLTVDIAGYLEHKAVRLQERGLKILIGSEPVVEREDGSWVIRTADHSVNCESVIYAAGHLTKRVSYWDWLPIHSVKGQVARFRTDYAFPYPCSISALGYLGSLNENEFTVGSTYEHKFDHTEPDDYGIRYLKERMKKVVPDLIESGELIGQWAGVRASTPNRKPILGEHPEHPNLYVFAGLGSKGMLYSAYLGDLLAKHILEDGPLPDEISISRISK
ncbi:NAD(P)/FAD-dependent oxidoreductase [Balneola sp. MJW-20]|uniref:NAD(P)/FAD-dependent oxidoreductase n=1 Tax=Gracilimonas aurantiaca TaxID=3234185 RepID=UPI003467B413